MSIDARVQALATRIGAVVKQRGIPAGGLSGEVLVKTSNTDYSVGWWQPQENGLPYPNVLVPGRWVNTTITGTSMTTAAAGASNRLYLVPFVPARDRSIDALGCNVTTAGTGNVRMGLYDSDPTTGLPTGAPKADTGLISTGTTGAKTSSLVVSMFANTQYWTAIVVDNTTAVFTAGAAAEMHPIAGGASQSNVGSNLGYVAHTTSTALPNLTSATLTWGSANVPMCTMRIL